jgi:ABC-type lipoprotein export system ATPase subunit
MDLPTSGHVTIGGEVVSSSSEHERSQLRLQKVGFVFQNFSLIPVLTMVLATRGPSARASAKLSRAQAAAAMAV